MNELDAGHQPAIVPAGSMQKVGLVDWLSRIEGQELPPSLMRAPVTAEYVHVPVKVPTAVSVAARQQTIARIEPRALSRVSGLFGICQQAHGTLDCGRAVLVCGHRRLGRVVPVAGAGLSGASLCAVSEARVDCTAHREAGGLIGRLGGWGLRGAIGDGTIGEQRSCSAV